MSNTNEVSSYYDKLTQVFLRYGQTKNAGAIHRAVRLPEYAHIRPEDTVHILIANELQRLASLTCVADLGCGVGASIHAVKRLLPASVQCSGITISHAQAALAKSLSVTVASYEELPYADAALDAVWAVESFAHSQRPERFFAEVTRVLRPGGLCIICDDMQTSTAPSLFVDAFSHGWMVPNIHPCEVHVERANSHNLRLRSRRDLTDGLTIFALPSVVAHRLLTLLHNKFADTMLIRSLLGSWALQQCYAERLMAYQFVVFEKQHA